MRIKKIILQNGYKRFKKTNIDLGENPKKIIALVGPNGSGKSSVFDGMLYIQNKHIRLGQYEPKNWKYHSMGQDPGFESKWQDNVKIEFDSGEFEKVYSRKNESGMPNTLFVFRSPHRHCSNLDIKSLSSIPGIAENNIGASSTIDLDDKITHNYQRLYSLIDRKYKTDDKIGYGEIKKQIIGELNTKLKNVLGLEIADHGDIQDGKGTLFFKKSDQENSFEFNVLSSGEKEVVDVMLDIFLKKETFTESIYIIDEPELHISTGIQRKLLKEVIEMIPSSCQLWIATHSIGFLNSLKQDYSKDADVIWFEGEFGSEEVCLKPIQKTRENWKKIFQTALEDLTGLLAPKKIIYCEGKKETTEDGKERGLDAEIYNIVFEEKYPDVLFVSSGGKNEVQKNSLLAIKILGKAFDDVELLLLRDRDVLTDTERLSFLEESSHHLMLERNELENYLFDKEIIKNFCSVHSKTFDEGNYDKEVNDINLQDLKAIQQKIQTTCSFSGKTRDFKIELAKLITKETEVYNKLESIIF